MIKDEDRLEILESIQKFDDRHQFVDEEINVGLAFQVRALRNKRNLTQEEFAKEIGVTQPLVSAWENPNYGKYTLNTLKELAKVFDVGLSIRFVPFSKMVNDALSLDSSVIAPASFNEENADAPSAVASGIQENHGEYRNQEKE